jgi:hypothetical protein
MGKHVEEQREAEGAAAGARTIAVVRNLHRNQRALLPGKREGSQSSASEIL